MSLLIGHTEPHCLRPERVGHKAATLARLSTKGYAVPPFFVLPVEACRRALPRPRWYGRSADLSLSQAKRKLEELPYGSDRFGPAFWQDFERRLAELAMEGAEPTVSVRSSSPLEDQAGYAMAGQFVTRLNISGSAEVWEAIKACWLSMWQGNVGAYLRTHRLRRRYETGVIVQRMIRPEKSGVLFTQEPVTGDTRRMLIEAVWGSPDGVESGTLEPESLYLDRQTLEPVGTSSGRFPEADRIALGTLGRELETYLGQPQDIEWAFEADKLWLLQSRPITTLGADHAASPTDAEVNEYQRQDAEGKLWTDYFFAERFAEPVSLLGWSILSRWIEKRAFREPLFYLGEDLLARSASLIRLWDGRPFTRVEAFQALYRVVPERAISEDKRRAFLGTGEPSLWWKALLRASPYLLSRLMVHDLNWAPQIHLRLWRHFRRAYLQALRRMATPPDDTLLQHTSHSGSLRFRFEVLEQLMDDLLSFHRWSITFADLCFHLLAYLIKRWLPDVPDETIISLIGGLPGNRTVEANVALARLSQQHPPSDEQLASFLSRYGHRARSLDPWAVTWRETPETVLAAASARHIDLTEQQKLLAERRADVERMLLADLSRGWRRYYRRPLFRHVLKLAQEFVLLRENQRDDWHRGLAEMRRCLLEMGAQLVEEGKLDTPEQVFFLTRLQLLAAFDDSIEVVRQQVQSARELWERAARPAPENSAEGRRPSDVRLHGIGSSAGRVRAQASVARTLQDTLQIPLGRILVVRSLDPAWTPAFARSSGLVSEVGGILSHASIIAREFRIPAVTSVAQATTLIRDGQWLQIDGKSGTVELLEDG